MEEMNRRQALGRLAAAGAGMVAANVTRAAPVFAQGQAPGVPAFRGQHEPKPLPFDPAKLQGPLREAHPIALGEQLRRRGSGAERGRAATRGDAEGQGPAALRLRRAEARGAGPHRLGRASRALLRQPRRRRQGRAAPSAGRSTRHSAARTHGKRSSSATATALGGGSGWVVLDLQPPHRRAAHLLGVGPHAQRADRACRSWCSTCTSTPIRWTTAPRRGNTSTRRCRTSAGRRWIAVTREPSLRPARFTARGSAIAFLGDAAKLPPGAVRARDVGKGDACSRKRWTRSGTWC